MGGLNEIAADARRDENVFDIAQAVAIHLYARGPRTGEATVYYADLWGSRAEKYTTLLKQVVTTLEYTSITPDRQNCGFLPHGDCTDEPTMRLDDVFEQYGAGVKTNRDAIAIGFDKSSLLTGIKGFDAKMSSAKDAAHRVQPILYRPFDVRKIFYHDKAVASRSLPTMQHMVTGENIGLVASTTWTTPERFSVNISTAMVEMKAGTHDRGTSFFPLYRYDEIMGKSIGKCHNLSRGFVDAWAATTGTEFRAVGSGDMERSSGPEDVLKWLYGLVHSNTYRHRYIVPLAQGLPLVFLSQNRDLIRSVTGLGEELIRLHLLQSPMLDKPIAEFNGPADPEVDKANYADRTVWLDRAKTYGFSGVPEEVWNFHIGGYQVCHKWLKDRQAKGGKNPRSARVLTAEDITHYGKIVTAIHHTIRLMEEIDEIIDAHGGWPDAFVTDPEQLEKLKSPKV